MGRHEKIPEMILLKPPKSSQKKKVLSKVCVMCGKSMPVTSFYTNAGEVNGLKRDRWCKECIVSTLNGEVSLREYMFKNNRAWSADLWNDAQVAAERELNTIKEYIENDDIQARQEMVDLRACRLALTMMNGKKYYRYIDNTKMPDDYDVREDMTRENALKRDSEDPYYNTPIYSREWLGRYTRSEIDQMDAYYENIIKTRGIEDSIGENYARQFVKQSAMVDSIAEKMRSDPSKELTSQYKESVAALEVLSQAAQLAPRYRKADSSIGLGSLGEFIKAMEYGELLMNEPAFPPDQIDGMIENLQHTVAATQGAGGFWEAENKKE